MKFRIIICLLLVVSLGLAFAIPLPGAKAQSVQELLNEQQELRKKLNETKNQTRTLNEEVARLDNQVRLNELEVQDIQGQIQSTQAHIIQTNGQISDVNQKLSNLAQVMDQTQASANARLRQSYKNSRTSNIVSVLTAEDFQAMMRNLEYLKKAKEEDDRILAEMVTAKKNYESQKANLENLKNEKESLQKQLVEKNNSIQVKQDELSSNMEQRASLLSQSKNEESRYGRLLAGNEARVAAMLYLSGVNGQNLGYFNRGDLIAYAGGTGCSTGPHVHFGYYQSASNTRSDINPWPLIQSGAIGWPGDSGSRIVTQWYGGAHNGLDIGVAENRPLYNAKAGNAKLKVIPKSVINSQGWCGYTNDNGQWVKVYAKTDQKEVWVYHNDGTMTVFAHVNGAVSK